MSFKKQLAIFCGITTLFVGPYLLLHGTNIVTHTYAFGAKQLVAGLSPYVPPEGERDWFKYSPLFGFLYYPISLLQSRAQAFAWGFLNILIFWGGIARAFPVEKKTSRWVWLAFIAASMELDGSSRYQQVNSLLIGLCLFGAADFREGKYFRSGLLLALATNLKILPIVILGPLCLPPRKKYILGVLTGFGLAFFGPSLWLGIGKNFGLLSEWFGVLAHDSGAAGILDIGSGAEQLGLSKYVGLAPVAVLSVLGLLAGRFLKERGFALTVSLAVLTMLLLSPRTESPTFVLVGAPYLFLMGVILKEGVWIRKVSLGAWLTAFFFITFCQNDLWPRAIWNSGTWHLYNKTFGALILWILNLGLIIRTCRSQFR